LFARLLKSGFSGPHTVIRADMLNICIQLAGIILAKINQTPMVGLFSFLDRFLQ